MSTLDTWSGLAIDPALLVAPFGHMTPTSYSGQVWPYLMACLAAFVDAVTAMDGPGTAGGFLDGRNGTSTTTITPNTGGSKTWTTQTGKSFAVGMWVTVWNASNKYVEGVVTAYNSGTGALTVSSARYTGSSGSSWRITQGSMTL